MLDNLKKYHIILGSKSPRRRELLQQMRIPFTVANIGADESYPDTLPPTDVPAFIASKKADAYLDMIHPNEMVITADTVVINGCKILGKPRDIDDAVRMLMSLSGKVHKVASGVCIMTTEKRTTFTTITDVKFASFSEEEARFYVENYMPLDKAGAYGIQEWIGCVAVESIHGSFYNVMGLPVHQLYKELKLF
ncbi:MAG: Maf family nucleotide pyrophosphatase [Bacteroidales bacterium]|nr:Maf family nucleotide pyrophosphatase [Bacteroidales bacterium]